MKVRILESFLNERSDSALTRVYDKIQYGDRTTNFEKKNNEKSTKSTKKLKKLTENPFILVLYQWWYLNIYTYEDTRRTKLKLTNKILHGILNGSTQE